MELYQGSLRQFAEELLANGKGNGQMVKVAQFCEHEIIYVFTYPYDESKLVKVVVHPNYKVKRDQFINAAKSWGIVIKEAFDNSQYRLIK
jgi:hypothetical protein